MSRIELVDRATASEEARELLDAVHAQLGATPNIFRALANSPKALAGVLSLNAQLSEGLLNAKTRTQLALITMEKTMKHKMRNGALFVASLIAILAVMALNVTAQDKMGDKVMIDKSKPTVAIIRADWCQACQKLEPTMMGLIGEYKDRLNFVLLDVTTDEKTAESAQTAQLLGISKFFESNKKKTSTVAVLDRKNKVLFKTIGNFDRDAYVRAFDEAVAKSKSMSTKKRG